MFRIHLLPIVGCLIFFMAYHSFATEISEETPLLIELAAEERPIVLLLEEEGFASVPVSLSKNHLEIAKSPVLNTMVAEFAKQSIGSTIEIPLPVASVESFNWVVDFLKYSLSKKENPDILDQFRIEGPEMLAHLISYAHKLDIVSLGLHLKNLFDHPNPDDHFRHFGPEDLDRIARSLAVANSGPKKTEDSRSYWAEYLSLRFGEYILRRGVAGDHALYNGFKRGYRNNRGMKLAVSHSIEGVRLCRKEEIDWQKGPPCQEMEDDKPVWLISMERYAEIRRKKLSPLQKTEAQEIAKAILADKIVPNLVKQTFDGKRKKIYVAVQASLAPAIVAELNKLGPKGHRDLRVKIDPDLPFYELRSTPVYSGGLCGQLECNKWQTTSSGAFLAHCSYCTSHTIGVVLCPVQILTCGWCFCCGQRTNFPYDLLNPCLECRTAECLFYSMHEGCTFLHSGCKGPERTLVIETSGW